MPDIAESTDLGIAWIKLGAGARCMGYICMREDGKVTRKQLTQVDRIRDAILGDLAVNEDTGQVTWKAGTLSFRDPDDFDFFKKAVYKKLDGDGIDFDGVKDACELESVIEDKAAELKQIAKEREEADRKG